MDSSDDLDYVAYVNSLDSLDKIREERIFLQAELQRIRQRQIEIRTIIDDCKQERETISKCRSICTNLMAKMNRN